MQSYRTIDVLGYGTMGSGIAQVVAQSGRDGVVLETDSSRIKTGQANAATFLDERGNRAQTETATEGLHVPD